MAEKSWLVELAPAGDPPVLEARAEGEERTALRNYLISADSAAEAQSLAEEQERLLAEQSEDEAWLVERVSAA